jgi:hypothetical protein
MRIKNFQTDNHKHTKKESRTDIYNPSFTNFIKESDKVKEGFENNVHKWIEVVSYCRWFP